MLHIAKPTSTLKARQNLGKYRIERRLAEGAFASVYRAFDTIEGVRVALKIPHAHLVTKEVLDDFRHEVRVSARLDHPNILPLKNAEFIDGHFVIAFPLGERTLGDRLQKRLSVSTALEYADQILDGLAHAHSRRIIHCDVKPDNFILFQENQLRLTDFGIAKVAMRTVHASGSGTVGYIAPEQAMGKPSFRSDVFSSGLVLYRMLSGHLPEWPFEWPPAGYSRLSSNVHEDLVQLLRRAIEADPRKRYSDAVHMQSAFRRIRNRALRRKSSRRTVSGGGLTTKRDWRTVRRRQFLKQYGQLLETFSRCTRCEAPVSERMSCCPWCGNDRSVHRGDTRFPTQCPRCYRGLKLDWRYCPWCYGEGFEVGTTRRYSDARYTARCTNSSCTRKELMPFMRYCPWCRRKVHRKWKIPGSNEQCSSCGWGVLRAYWSHCPWCCKSLGR